MYKEVNFKTKAEADEFKRYLSMKAVKYASIESTVKVVIRDIITNDNFNDLLIGFGKWIA